LTIAIDLSAFSGTDGAHCSTQPTAPHGYRPKRRRSTAGGAGLREGVVAAVGMVAVVGGVVDVEVVVVVVVGVVVVGVVVVGVVVVGVVVGAGSGLRFAEVHADCPLSSGV
jgi:hypothetical protein